ncbi:MAG TPA: toll/interleukin-1 receptor domain-containing protein [Caulobacteraceae bacterium]|nr:toll/interleukin-1 receptor domain-containing protein [Caulobacteraceae bacterium]
MTDVFISYKREDEVRVGRLARALEKAGFSIWWDRGLPGGESWRANITAALDAARCVVVVWSHGSVGPEGAFVRDEATRAMVRGVLVPAMIDRVAPPLGFGELQAIDLTRWRGAQGDPFFQDLVGVIRAKLDDTPTPKPRGPNARVARRIFYGASSSAGFAAFAAFAFNTFGVATNVCTIPGPQPALSDACGAWRLGERPTRDERLAWAAKPASSCQALRDHIARFPEGAYRREAADLLTARRVTTEDVWSPSTRQLALFQPQATDGAPDEAAARAKAVAAAQTQADNLCRGFAATTAFRFRAASPQPQTWTCAKGGGGVVCGFDGQVVCQLDERATVERETCGPRPG